ncbi:(S)-2-haloacid dehalogenase 4A [Cytospora mali]|uniref:(S)-2-haloacid dehalogenase 4A n=1 Tax=Cytospora mali TaxID=578113 RepID=A0A194UWH0_CYTMA|nr:(S)-2-haloacid dehalogenase 4A [Valsa mali var. pyri (nom. inval.)]
MQKIHTFPGCKAIFFDFMGTCLDWHSSIVAALPERIPRPKRSQLAIDWREAFFQDIHDRFEKALPQEDIDTTHARLLESLLQTKTTEIQEYYVFSKDEKEKAVRAWHNMSAWPDVSAALAALRQKYEVFVLANGTTRLQLDLGRSSGLQFDMMFSSQLLGETKPDLEIYKKAMRLVGVAPEESLMVAAHAYDLRAAKKVGMSTVYVRRWTEDTREDMRKVEEDVDIFIGKVDGSEPGPEPENVTDRSFEDLVRYIT